MDKEHEIELSAEEVSTLHLVDAVLTAIEGLEKHNALAAEIVAGDKQVGHLYRIRIEKEVLQ